MRVIIAGWFLALILASEAPAQETGQVTPEPCIGLAGATAEEIDARIAELEKAGNALKEKLAARTAEPASARPRPAEIRKLEQDLRRNQEDRLDLIFTRECLRTANLSTNRTEMLASRGDERKWVEITTYYATNRQATGNAAPEEFFGPDRAGDLQLGRVVVSIPTARNPGEMPLPSIWRLEFRSDPNKHFILKSVTPLAGDAVRQEIAEKFASGMERSVLLFVHGYNSRFAEAALRTAQLAHDLAFPGIPMLFSWPSLGRTAGYWRDEEMAQLSEPAFDALLDELSALDVDAVYVIAHSMGNRLVAGALRDRALSGRPVGNLKGLLLAAPDINEELFRERIVPAIASLEGVQRTIYASGSDVAITASKIVHDFRRVGDTSEGVATFPGFETIDASAAAPLTRSFGHSYVVDSAKVLQDVAEIVRRSFGADQRGLPRQGSPPSAYWLLR